MANLPHLGCGAVFSSGLIDSVGDPITCVNVSKLQICDITSYPAKLHPPHNGEKSTDRNKNGEKNKLISQAKKPNNRK